MKYISLLALAGALVSFAVPAPVHAVTYTADFTTDPSLLGWQTFGDTNLFQWNPTNRDLQVTWDSTQTNSYFYHPLDFAVTANDDFSVELDLTLADIATDTEPGKTGPMPLGFEFMDLAAATNASFSRTSYGGTPNIAGLDYYPYGYILDGGLRYDSVPTTTPTFVSGTDSTDYAPQTFAVYDDELPLNVPVHLSFAYTATNQTAVITLTTNGVPLVSLPPLVLNGSNGFTETNYNFQVNAFCLGSFSSYGDIYDSVLAHGAISNLVVNVPPPAQNLSPLFTNGTWQVQFTDHLGWSYSLQRTTNFLSWQTVSAAVAGNGTNLVLADGAAAVMGAFYRVSASRP